MSDTTVPLATSKNIYVIHPLSDGIWTNDRTQGITEYVVTDPKLLSEAIETALYDKRIRGDDMEFYSATRGWAECIAVGSFDTYRHRFEETARFFGDRLKEAGAVSSRLIATVAAGTQNSSSSNRQ